jgi:hypothetical protein
LIQHTVTFKNYDESILLIQTVNQGVTAVYSGPTPTRESTAQYTYTFTGWDKSLTNITSSFTTIALYSETTNGYTITWENYDGTVLEIDTNVPYGTTPTFNGQTPYKGDSEDYKFTFSSWLPEVAIVTENTTYVAQFTQSLNYIPITSAEELSNVRNNLSGNFRLMNNVDLNNIEWTPIGTDTAPFTGVIDGKDFIISNLKITTSQVYIGLFGYNAGIIKNIKLSNVLINVNGGITTNIYGGAFIGYGNGEVYNLHTLSGSITIKRRADKIGYVGGIIGYQNSTIYNTNLSNKLNVTGELTEATGGLIGFTRRVSLFDSFNTGNIVGSITYTGGLIGYVSSSINISTSYNNGYVEGTTTNTSTNSSVGGLLGYSVGETSIESSYNGGVVIGFEEIGGLIGKTASTTIINKSFNLGFVFGSEETAGFVGRSNGSINISDSYNSGTITASWSSIGGLIGVGIDRITIMNAYNSGVINASVSSSYYVGGLVGLATSKLYVYSSINFSNVSAQRGSTLSGGITGNVPSDNGFDDTFYTGSISENANQFGTKITDLTTFHLEFFTTTLGWDTEIWDFTGLDIANGVYPTLKNMPEIPVEE